MKRLLLFEIANLLIIEIDNLGCTCTRVEALPLQFSNIFVVSLRYSLHYLYIYIYIYIYIYTLFKHFFLGFDHIQSIKIHELTQL